MPRAKTTVVLFQTTIAALAQHILVLSQNTRNPAAVPLLPSLSPSSNSPACVGLYRTPCTRREASHATRPGTTHCAGDRSSAGGTWSAESVGGAVAVAAVVVIKLLTATHTRLTGAAQGLCLKSKLCQALIAAGQEPQAQWPRYAPLCVFVKRGAYNAHHTAQRHMLHAICSA